MGEVILGPFGGLKNTVPKESFAPGDLWVADNTDINDAKIALRRDGWGTRKASGDFSNIWSAGGVSLVVQGGAIKLINADWSVTTLVTGISGRVSFFLAPGANRIYWSTEREMGCIENLVNRSWGMTVPSAPAVQVVPGSMPIGRYRFLVTHIGQDGQESGTGGGVDVVQSAVAGLQFTVPQSTNSYVKEKAVYLTYPDGTELFMVAILPNTTTSLTITTPTWGEKLESFLMTPPVPGQAIAAWKGRMLVMSGRTVAYSPAYRMEVMDGDDFVDIGARGTILAPVEGGIFVATAYNTYFLEGSDADGLRLRHLATYGGVEGTLAYDYSSPGENGSGATFPAPVWMSTRGIVFGQPSGGLVNVTEPNYRFESASLGSAVVRSTRGFRQYVTVIHKTSPPRDAA